MFFKLYSYYVAIIYIYILYSYYIYIIIIDYIAINQIEKHTGI